VEIGCVSTCLVTSLSAYQSLDTIKFAFFKLTRGLGSSVGIATGYGLDGPGIETVCIKLSPNEYVGE
jgi:hypothetical protein